MIKSITVDTLTAIQTDEYMTDRMKPGHDKWKDYGQSIYIFMNNIQLLGFELVLILGEPGTGKSSGMRTLPTKTNIWFNADKKNPVWEGGKAEYGKKSNPVPNFHMIPTKYGEIITHVQGAISKGLFAEEKYAFILGHTETYKKGEETLERLKTLGNMATKMQLEGKVETVMYSRVEKGDDGKLNYILETQNSGYNTARSPQNLFEGKINNDYNLIIEKLSNY